MGPLDSFRANAATFYDFATGDRHNLLPRYIIILLCGFGVALAGFEVSTDGISSIVSVLGVLLGFGYSVQFYLASTTSPKIQDEDYLEDIGDKRVLFRLTVELFNNVAYLNFAILFALIPTISLLIQPPKVLFNFQALANTLHFFGSAAAWSLIMESMLTFYRILRRSSFFFSERRRLEGE